MQDLVNAVVEMMETEAMALTKKYLDEGKPPMQIFDAYRGICGVQGGACAARCGRVQKYFYPTREMD